MKNVRQLFVMLAILVLLAGCGVPAVKLGYVSGTIKIDGQPAPGIGVTFSPTASGGTTSSGYSDEQGRYEAAFTFRKKGVMLGENVASFSIPPGESSSTSKIKLPKKYSDGEGVIVNVKSGKQTIDFDLTN